MNDLFYAEVYRRSYYRFFLEFWDTVVQEELIESPHIKFLCDELQKVAERVIKRLPKQYDLIINISPGESKSTIATVLLPCWLWANDPSLRIISGSYSSSLSLEHSLLSKDCITSDKYKRYFGHLFSLRKDANAKSNYKTDKGGQRYSTSVGATVTGIHGNILIVDDPLNPKQALSKIELPKASYWINRTLSSRKVDKANVPTILIMQRLGEGDPTGIWLEKAKKGKRIRHICLPATDDYEIKPKEAKSLYQNGVLNPKRTGLKVLNDAKIDLGDRDFAGQYGQSPKPLDGNLVKKEWFKYYRKQEIIDLIKRGQVVANAYIDTALSEKHEKGNDPTGILIYAFYKNRWFLLNWLSKRLGFPELIDELIMLQQRELSNRSMLSIENKSNGKSVQQMLVSATMMNVVLDNIKGDKTMRLNEQTPKLQTNRVFLPEGELWVDDFLEQLLLYPNAKHDEAVDCLTGMMRTAEKRQGYSIR